MALLPRLACLWRQVQHVRKCDTGSRSDARLGAMHRYILFEIVFPFGLAPQMEGSRHCRRQAIQASRMTGPMSGQVRAIRC